jgi:hypothetical protein
MRLLLRGIDTPEGFIEMMDSVRYLRGNARVVDLFIVFPNKDLFEDAPGDGRSASSYDLAKSLRSGLSRKVLNNSTANNLPTS